MGSASSTDATPAARSRARPAARGLRRAARLALAGALLAAGGACYTVTPTTTSRLTPGDRLAVDLNDQGRTALGQSIGPELRRVSGTYVGESGDELELRVMDVTNLDGQRTTWSGESIRIRREHVRDLYERKFSRGRTAVVVALAAAGAIAFIATRGLFGFGGAEGGDGGNNGGNQQ